jgi:hypothetical protein
MTIRAVLLGLLGAMFIAALTYLHDHIWRLGNLVGSHLPVFVFGVLFILILVLNPLLGAMNRRWRLKPTEMAVGMMMLFAVCSVPSYGFFGVFPKATVLAGHYYPNHLSWVDNGLRERIPGYLLPGDGEAIPELTSDFKNGIGTEEYPISMSQVPWRYWNKPLTVWLPIVIVMAGTVICLGLVLHRQWTVNERLRYPIAEIATQLINQGPGTRAPSIMRNHVFWVGLGIVLFIRIVNGVYLWTDEKTLQIPLTFDFLAFPKYFVSLEAEQWRNFIFQPTLFPTVIGIAFLLASDVSLSLGLAPVAIMTVTVFFMNRYGQTIRVVDYMEGGPVVWQRFGSYLALLLVIFYVGRNYYWTVLRRTFGFARKDRTIEPYITRASRLFFILLVALIVMLWRIGLELPFAIITVGLILLTYLGMARINSESGLFLNLPRWQPVGVMLGMMGAVAMGPKAILIVSLLSVVFTVGAWECFMPFFMNGLRICTDLEVKPGRVGVSAMGTYIVGIIIAIPVILYVNYNFGANRDGSFQWSTAADELPSYIYHPADKAVTEMNNEASLSRSEAMTSWERLDVRNWTPQPRFFAAVIAGIALVLVVSFCRLRFPWWPLHPVMFMVWGTRQMATLSFSFFVGWLIKAGITRFAGNKSYQAAKLFFIGIIAGDLLGGMGFMVISIIHHLVTGDTPKSMPILPGVI